MGSIWKVDQPPDRLLAEASEQLRRIGRYVADRAGERIAGRFAAAILARCENLSRFPDRGTRRDDLRRGLRLIGVRRRVTVAFAVEADVVTIVGVFYAGQDVERAIRSRARLTDGAPLSPILTKRRRLPDHSSP